MKPFLRWCFVATALTLAGCSNSAWRKSEVLAVPLQPTLQQEVILARMEQILASRALTDDERAQLLYERGVLYDSLGLRALARNYFSQALAIRPDMPEVFNYLGIYLTQAGNFDAAYEAFDSVLELDPTYNYALTCHDRRNIMRSRDSSARSCKLDQAQVQNQKLHRQHQNCLPALNICLSN